MTGSYQHPQALVEEGAVIGEGTRIWAFTHVQKGAVVGRDCNICNGGFIESGAVVGDRVTIKHNVSVFEGVTIEDDVFIGSNIAFINDQYPRSRRADWTLLKTRIRQGATLGANAVILGGITVGRYALVGAGSVVTRDVPAYRLVRGNPAVIVGWVCRCGRPVDAERYCTVCQETIGDEDDDV